ncbi:uncharacterized protein LOC143256980 [Tachypleus tridentatus]|uniref:uncharacterized protein LOC143256980 n=1 Tax=Tachypleus tridentatus TaxID=6853 RepID=UPI003FD55E7F
MLRKQTSWGWTLLFGNLDTSSRRYPLVLLFVLLLLIGAGLVAGIYFAVGNTISYQKEISYRLLESRSIKTVDGEFKITNRDFNPELKRNSSLSYLMLERELLYFIDTLFKQSPLANIYNMTVIVKFRPGSIIVNCRILLKTTLHNIIENVGQAFRESLEQNKGFLMGGMLKLDMESVIFRPSATWSSWGQWSSCSHDNQCDQSLIKRRLRNCLSIDEKKVLNNEACQWQEGLSVEEQKCVCSALNVSAKRILVNKISYSLYLNTSPIPATSIFTTATIIAEPVGKSVSGRSKGVTTQNFLSSTVNEFHKNISINTRRPCHQCHVGEICLLRPEELIPYCVPVRNTGDSRGCGGWCNGPYELCDRLDDITYQCVDETECLLTEWKCGNGLCIPKERRCDGHFNCFDDTDELDCACSKNGFHCGNKTSCIELSKRCDGYYDCWDGNDESNCSLDCSSTEFTCMNGMCIPASHFCDKYNDCTDHSDEPNGCA